MKSSQKPGRKPDDIVVTSNIDQINREQFLRRFAAFLTGAVGDGSFAIHVRGTDLPPEDSANKPRSATQSTNTKQANRR
jgi:hypothetical protein